MNARAATLAILAVMGGMQLHADVAQADTWSQEYGTTTVFVEDPLAPAAYEDWGWGAPIPERPCRYPAGSADWCLYVRGGWVRYRVHLEGPEGKGFDDVYVNARVQSPWGDCGIALTYAGASDPEKDAIAKQVGPCPETPGTYRWNTNLGARASHPYHQGNPHDVWIWCVGGATESCHLRIHHDVKVTGSYRPFRIGMDGLTRAPLDPTTPEGLAPETCADLRIGGSPHHRNVAVSVDWGLGAGAIETFTVDLGDDGNWEERRCQVLPLSLLDYNVCFQANEVDGLRRDLTECRTVSGGLL